MSIDVPPDTCPRLPPAERDGGHAPVAEGKRGLNPPRPLYQGGLLLYRQIKVFFGSKNK